MCEKSTLDKLWFDVLVELSIPAWIQPEKLSQGDGFQMISVVVELKGTLDARWTVRSTIFFGQIPTLDKVRKKPILWTPNTAAILSTF